MDIFSQLSLFKAGRKIHHVGNYLSEISLSWGLIERHFYKEISFSELKEKDIKSYESILNTITDTLKDYPVKI